MHSLIFFAGVGDQDVVITQSAIAYVDRCPITVFFSYQLARKLILISAYVSFRTVKFSRNQSILNRSGIWRTFL